MNNDIEAFRFMAIRPPDSSSVDSNVQPVPLASDEEIGQSSDPEQAEVEAKKIARWLDEKLENVDSEDHAKIDSLLSSKKLNKKTAVSASIKFGQSAKILYTLSKHALPEDIRDRIGDINLLPPLVIDIPKPTIPDEILQKLLDKRKAFFGPVGVGDLMIVEQILAGYEFGEIAHVENVLGFETRSRDHKVRTELDVFTEAIEETQQFSETDLQSTERFELKNSIKEEIASQQKRDISHRVNAQYPPYVETEAEFNYSKDNSKQKSTEKSSDFAREVTERAINRTEERIQLTRSQRRNIQTEESNHHGFENKTKDNIVGVYRHVDKIYKMRLTRRSPRLFYEFIVPSPGRYLRALNNKPKPPNTELEALRQRLIDIQPLNVELEEISFTQYDEYIRRFGLTGVEPPPPSASTVAPLILAKNILDRDTSSGGFQNYNFTDGEFEVPDGYKAVSATITFAARKINDGFGEITAGIGGHFFDFTEDDLERRGDLVTKPIEVENFEQTTGKIPFSVTARHDAIIGVSFEVKCKKITDDREKWRVNLYNAIVASHEARVQELLTRISELEAREKAAEFQQNFGLSPNILRDMEA